MTYTKEELQKALDFFQNYDIKVTYYRYECPYCRNTDNLIIVEDEDNKLYMECPKCNKRMLIMGVFPDKLMNFYNKYITE